MFQGYQGLVDGGDNIGDDTYNHHILFQGYQGMVDGGDNIGDDTYNHHILCFRVTRAWWMEEIT